MRIPNDAVVLVADGRKSLYFRNEGDAAFLKLVVEDKSFRPNPAHHEQASDAAGRAMNTRGSSMTEVDFHVQEETRFAADIAEDLKARALAGEFETLIVVAPPEALGELRKRYHKEVARRIVAEVPKDLVNLPVDQIERVLTAD